MRFVQISITIFVCVLSLTWSAAVGQPEQTNIAADSLLSVDSGNGHSNEGARQARFYYGYFSQPYYNYYGGYGGYGNYYRPYYGYGYNYGYYRPYGAYWRPYYGGYGGFYG